MPQYTWTLDGRLCTPGGKSPYLLLTGAPALECTYSLLCSGSYMDCLPLFVCVFVGGADLLKVNSFAQAKFSQ